jgi:hypothetical protein
VLYIQKVGVGVRIFLFFFEGADGGKEKEEKRELVQIGPMFFGNGMVGGNVERNCNHKLQAIVESGPLLLGVEECSSHGCGGASAAETTTKKKENRKKSSKKGAPPRPTHPPKKKIKRDSTMH